ncbi:hypothetical protein [Streptomyces sp. NPDC002671]
MLVPATLWPDQWTTLTIRTDQDPDAQARELLDRTTTASRPGAER